MTIKFNKSETLIIVALENEYPKDLIEDWRVVYSGIGKVNSLISLSRAISEERPKTVINFGTAGSIDPNLQGLTEITNVKERDMEK